MRDRAARERGERHRKGREKRGGGCGGREASQGKWAVTKVWDLRLGHRERGGHGERRPLPPEYKMGGSEKAVLGCGQGRHGRHGGLRSIVGLFLHPTWNDKRR